MAVTNKTLLNTNSDQFLDALGIQPSSEAEKQEILEQLTQHFDTLILETVASSLDSAQKIKFKQLIQTEPEKLEEWIAAASSQIPGLAKKIDAAIVAEIEAIRTASQKNT